MYTTCKHGLAAYLDLLGYTPYIVTSTNKDGRIEIEFGFEEDVEHLAKQWDNNAVTVKAKEYFIKVKHYKNLVTNRVRDELHGNERNFNQ